MFVIQHGNGDENYLMHHGIAGQKWGVLHGPPYPLYRQEGSGFKKGQTKLPNSKIGKGKSGGSGGSGAGGSGSGGGSGSSGSASAKAEQKGDSETKKYSKEDVQKAVQGASEKMNATALKYAEKEAKLIDKTERDLEENSDFFDDDGEYDEAKFNDWNKRYDKQQEKIEQLHQDALKEMGNAVAEIKPYVDQIASDHQKEFSGMAEHFENGQKIIAQQREHAKNVTDVYQKLKKSGFDSGEDDANINAVLGSAAVYQDYKKTVKVLEKNGIKTKDFYTKEDHEKVVNALNQGSKLQAQLEKENKATGKYAEKLLKKMDKEYGTDISSAEGQGLLFASAMLDKKE